MNPETIQKGYEKYKKEWEQKQNEDFIAECKVHFNLYRMMLGLTKNTILSCWTISRNRGGNSPKRITRNLCQGLRVAFMTQSILEFRMW